jgi:hypothetical protein
VTRVLYCVVSIATIFALALPSAHAFFDPPWITPTAPVAGATVSVNLRDGICDAIVEHPGYPQIARKGQAIHLVEYGHHWDDADIGHLVEPIGAFPPGDYTVSVDFIYDDYPFGLTKINLGVIPFSVTGAASVVEVPASTPSGLTALLFLMGCLALRGVRMRRDDSMVAAIGANECGLKQHARIANRIHRCQLSRSR